MVQLIVSQQMVVTQRYDINLCEAHKNDIIVQLQINVEKYFVKQLVRSREHSTNINSNI